MATNYYKNGRYKYNSGDSNPMKWASAHWITMESKFPGKCVFCGAHIIKGQNIALGRLQSKTRPAHPTCLNNWQETQALSKRSKGKTHTQTPNSNKNAGKVPSSPLRGVSEWVPLNYSYSYWLYGQSWSLWPMSVIITKLECWDRTLCDCLSGLKPRNGVACDLPWLFSWKGLGRLLAVYAWAHLVRTHKASHLQEVSWPSTVAVTEDEERSK